MKKLIALILMITFLLSLAACSGGYDNTTEENHASTSIDQERNDTTSSTVGEQDDGLVIVYLKASYVRRDYKTEYAYDDNGNMIKEEVYCRDEEEGETEYTFYRTTERKYDENNRLVEELLKNNRGEVSHYSYEYDENGNMILEIRYFSYDNGETIKWHFEDTYTYDENGNCIEFYETRNGEPWVRYSYAYDELNRLIEEKYYSPVDKLNSYYTYEYTDNTQKHIAYTFGKLSYGYIKTFDENGNQIRYDYYYEDKANYMDAESGDYKTWVYDAEGRVLEYAKYESGTLTMKEVNTYECTYDQNDKLIEMKTYHNGELEYKTEFIYDENGALLEENKYIAHSIYDDVFYQLTETITYIAVRVTQERAEELNRKN